MVELISSMLLEGDKGTVKELIFEILSREYPLKIIELTNHIKKRYGKSVTFQAVRKALLQLKKENVVKEEQNKYAIRKEWVETKRKELQKLHDNLTGKTTTPKRIESITDEVTVFHFNSLNELMKFWQTLNCFSNS